jgi:hypothetical protein
MQSNRQTRFARGFEHCCAMNECYTGDARMTHADQEQRIEELQIALSRAFEARKRPSVSAIDDGDDIVLRISWVTQSTRDTSLDARCAADVFFSSNQIARYADRDTAQRQTIQARLIQRVQQAFASQADADADACSVSVRIDDALLDTP